MGEESGTPVYDLSHHSWGYTDTSKKDATFLYAFAMLIVIALASASILSMRWRITILPEACVVLTVGLVAGFVCKAMYAKTETESFSRPLMDFDNALFFLGLLPPIIFKSGYELSPAWLFGLFSQIMAFAIAGTLLSALIVALTLSLASNAGWAPDVSFHETLTFGALISATDPVSVLAVFQELRVDPKMFYVVFGESVLNDAVGIVLFKTFSKLVGYRPTASTLWIATADFVVIFGGSMILGLSCALCTSACLRILRAPPPKKDDDDDDVVEAALHLQLAVLACSMYIPAFFAEIVELSGIVATLFAAIGIRHWGTPNLQEKHAGDEHQHVMADSLLGTMAHIADTAVFLYLGLSVPATFNDWQKNYSHSLVAFAIGACLVGRAAHVYPLSYLLNRQVVKHAKKEYAGRPRAFEAAVQAGTIPKHMQHMLWFSGLRGAVAFSCAHVFPQNGDNKNRKLFTVTTSTIIIISVYLLGALTVPVLDYLEIPKNCRVPRDNSSPVHAQQRDPVPNEAPRPSAALVRFASIDETYIYPYVVRLAPRRAKPSHKRECATLSSDDSDASGDNLLPRLCPDEDDEDIYVAPPPTLEMVQLARSNEARRRASDRKYADDDDDDAASAADHDDLVPADSPGKAADIV